MSQNLDGKPGRGSNGFATLRVANPLLPLPGFRVNSVTWNIVGEVIGITAITST